MTTVRRADPSELDGGTRLFLQAIGAPASATNLEVWSGLAAAGRHHVALDGGQVVATGFWTPIRTAVVGGREVRSAQVSGVAVRPTHRRRGLLTALMTALLDDVRDAGRPIASLRASEGGIYARFGWGPATPELRCRLPRGARFAPWVPATTADDRLEEVPHDRLDDVLPRRFEAVWRTRPGEHSRDHQWPRVRATYDRFAERCSVAAVTHPDGGFAVVAVDTEEGRATVLDLLAPTPAGYRALWRHVLDLDLVREVEARLAVREPLRWLLADPRDLRPTGAGEGVWLRLLDPPAVLAARAYPTDGDLVLDLRDPTRPDAAGRWRLSVRDGRATVEATDGPAQLALDTAHLAATCLGGVAPSELAAAGAVDVIDGAALPIADALLASAVAPLCTTPL